MISAYQAQLTDNRHRGLVVISGAWSWAVEQLPPLDKNTLWLGADAVETTTEVKPTQARQWLGRECEHLVINGFDGIDLNALGALSGTVKAGGLCYLLCPDFPQWLKTPDPQNERYCVFPHQSGEQPNRWLSYLIEVIKASESALLITQGQPAKTAILPQVTATGFEHPHCKTKQQLQAVERIIKVATGHRRRPLVLTADRGRGKSSALGLAVVELFKQGKSKIIISAPQVTSTSAVFERITEQLQVLEQNATLLKTELGELQFVPPDELIATKHSCDLLLVDEAAAIPAPMLTEILKAYSRIAFTSTIHGYEGTGRGFEIRFKQTLNQLTPDWSKLEMTQPIRYAQHDPLEQFTNRALMLDAKAAELENTDVDVRQLHLKQWNRDELLNDSECLSQLMGLLTLSHYKTTPNDFRHLLDGSNIQVFSFCHQGKILAATLLAIEGGLPQTINEQIWQGKRRPNGHLLPQTLGFHGGFIGAGEYRFARVIRIAVHPQLQNLGLGSQMLKHLSRYCADTGIDFLGSSFGATASLLQFWHNNDFTTVRLGITQDATSNEYSSVVLQGLNNQARQFCDEIKHKFDREFYPALTEFYHKLSHRVIWQLLSRSTHSIEPLTPQEQFEVEGFIHHNREYEFCTYALQKMALHAITNSRCLNLSEQDKQLLLNKVFRRHNWQQICKTLGLQGKKAAQKQLKVVFSQLNQ